MRALMVLPWHKKTSGKHMNKETDVAAATRTAHSSHAVQVKVHREVTKSLTGRSQARHDVTPGPFERADTWGLLLHHLLPVSGLPPSKGRRSVSACNPRRAYTFHIRCAFCKCCAYTAHGCTGLMRARFSSGTRSRC